MLAQTSEFGGVALLRRVLATDFHPHLLEGAPNFGRLHGKPGTEYCRLRAVRNSTAVVVRFRSPTSKFMSASDRSHFAFRGEA